MTPEDKDLLLKDLCGRLPYWQQIGTEGDNEPYTLLSVHPNKDIALIGIDMDGMYATSKVKIDTIKPYLRPMSSMTEEEKNLYLYWCENDTIESMDWLNKKMFDFRGLIDKGLAIEVTEELYIEIRKHLFDNLPSNTCSQ